jgi:hypothetical protein
MTWTDFLKPTIAKIVVTIVIVVILYYLFYQTVFITWSAGSWIIGIIFWYLMSCLIVFGYQGTKTNKPVAKE